MTTELQKELASMAIDALEAQLEEADRLYYDEAAPVIEDTQYDALVAAYKRMTGLQWHRQGSLGDIPHTRLMGTLDKVYTAEELVAALGERECLVMPKIDGAGIELVYGPGGLQRALTRGKRVAGTSYGEDITSKVKHIQGVLSHLQDPPWAVRGEVYMTEAAFQQAQALRAAAGEEPFKNRRNAAAGILKKGDPAYLALLSFVAYQAFDPRLAHHEDTAFLTMREQLMWLGDAGFETPEWALGRPGSDLTPELLQDWPAGCSHLSFETDGVVIVIDDAKVQRQLGYSTEFPRFAVAFKFADEVATTPVKAILWETGRTGRIVPKYQLEPVELEGATIEFATGHNWEQLQKLDAWPGDIVEVVRAGMIIPQVVRVAERKAVLGVDGIHAYIPSQCPACQQPVWREENGVDLMCVNDGCPAQLAKRLVNMFGKKNLDVDGFGESLAVAMVEQEFVGTPADIFVALAGGLIPGTFTDRREHFVGELARLKLGEAGVVFGEKRAKALAAAIDQAVATKPWHVVLHALGCPGLGEPECRGIAAKWGLRDLFNWANVAPDEDLPDPKGAFITQLTNLKGIGKTTAETLWTWLNTSPWLTELEGTGLQLEAEGEPAVVEGPLTGKTVVLTGTCSVPRSVLEGWVTAAGGTCSSAVSRKTDYVCAGEAAGSKLEKAQRLGVPVIDEAELRKLAAVS